MSAECFVAPGTPVRVHPNVRKPYGSAPRRFVAWSIANARTRLVIAHVPFMVLRDVRFLVSAAGRARVLRTGVKNVHAWAIGSYTGDYLPDTAGLVEVCYRPRADRPATFWYESDRRSVEDGRVFSRAYLTPAGTVFVDPEA